MFPTRASLSGQGVERSARKVTVEGPVSESMLQMIFSRSTPPSRGNQAILAAYHSSPTLQAVAQRVAESMATIPYAVFNDGEEVFDHPLTRTLANPNPVFSGFIYRWLQQHYIDLLGETFDLMFRGEDGGLELYPVPPTSISQEPGRGVMRYRVRMGDLDEVYPAEQVLHIRRPNLIRPYGRGTGIGHAIADEVELSEYITKHTKAEFYNGARPDFLIYLPGAGAEEARRFKEEWGKRYAGVGAAGQPAVIGEDPEQVVIRELSRNLADMEAASFKEMENELIRRAWGVPPEVIGIVSDSNRATITESLTIYGRFVLKPRATFWASEWEHKLLPLIGEDGDTIIFEDPDPGDQDHRRELMRDHRQAFTINEIRAEAGKPPREDGDRYLAPHFDLPNAGDVEGAAEQRGPTVYRIHLKDPTEDRAQIVADALKPDTLELDLSDVVQEKIREFAREMAKEIPGIGDIDGLFFMLDPRIREYVHEFGADRVVQINDTTKKDLRTLISQAIKEGINPREIRGQILGYVEEIIPNRGEVIARTEMLRASNYGRHETMKASGVVDWRKWLATHDDRTRPEHLEMHGQTRRMGEPFQAPDGSTADYPGDFGIAWLDIQCRCTTRAHFPELENLSVKVPSDDVVIKQYVESYEGAVESFKRDVMRSMRRQFTEDLLPRFDQVFHQELSDAS